jgi:hypothetical protein
MLERHNNNNNNNNNNIIIIIIIINEISYKWTDYIIPMLRNMDFMAQNNIQ